MTTTTERPRTEARGSVAAATRCLLRAHWPAVGWVFAVLVAAAALAVTVVALVSTPEYSIVAFARQVSVWFPFSLTISVLMSVINAYLAMGGTRRDLGRAAILTALGMSVVYAVGVVGVLQLERGVYALAGWEHEIRDEFQFFATSSQVGLLLSLHLVSAAAGQLCGLLAGIVYYRVGGWWGTLALPLTVGPIPLIEVILGADLPFLTGGPAAGTGGGGAVRVALAAVVLALVAAAFARILRTTPLRSSPAV